jgi:hypothetical protein
LKVVHLHFRFKTKVDHLLQSAPSSPLWPMRAHCRTMPIAAPLNPTFNQTEVVACARCQIPNPSSTLARTQPNPRSTCRWGSARVWPRRPSIYTAPPFPFLPFPFLFPPFFFLYMRVWRDGSVAGGGTGSDGAAQDGAAEGSRGGPRQAARRQRLLERGGRAVGHSDLPSRERRPTTVSAACSPPEWRRRCPER